MIDPRRRRQLANILRPSSRRVRIVRNTAALCGGVAAAAVFLGGPFDLRDTAAAVTDPSIEMAAGPGANTVPEQSWVIVAADNTAAVLAHHNQVQARLANATHRTVWSAKNADTLPGVAVCVGSCKDLILSGSNVLNPVSDPADPPPVSFGDAPRIVPSYTTSVLAAKHSPSGHTDLLIARSDATGATWLEIVAGPGTRRVNLPPGKLSATQATNGSLVIQDTPPLAAPSVFVAVPNDTDGWLLGPPIALYSIGSCSNTNSSMVLTYGSPVDPDPVRLRLANGRTISLGHNTTFTTCGFGPSRIFVTNTDNLADLPGATPAHPISGTTIDAYDLAGKSLWHKEFAGAYNTSVNPTGDQVLVYSGTANTWLVLDATGRTVKELPNVSDARFTSTGALVTVSPTGELSWLK